MVEEDRATLNEIYQDIYEMGELEREAARQRQWFNPDGWWARVLRWCERQARAEREDLIKERDEFVDRLPTKDPTA